MWRRLVILAAVMGGALTGAALALQSDRVAENLRVRLILYAQEKGYALSIGRFEVGVLPPAVTLDDVSLTKIGEPEPMATLHRGTISMHPWPSATGALVIDHLELDGLRADVDVDTLPSFGGGDGELAVDIRELLLWNLDVILRRDDDLLRLSRTDLTMRPADDDLRQIALNVGSADVFNGVNQIGFEVQVNAALQGSLDRPVALLVERGRLFLDEVALDAHGKLLLEGEPAAALEVSGSASLKRAAELFPELQGSRGAARFKAQLDGALLAPRARVELQVDDLFVIGRDLGDLEVTAGLDGRRARLEAFKLTNGRVGTITGSGALEITAGLPLDVRARLHDVSLPWALDLAGMPDAWVRGEITADLELKGALATPSLTGRLSGSIRDAAVLDKSFRDPGAALYIGAAELGIEGTLLASSSGINLSELKLKRLGSELVLQGSMSYDAEAGMELQMLGERFELSDWGPVSGTLYGGRGSLAGAIEGSYRDPTVTATVDFDGFAIGDYLVGDTRATLIYRSLLLEVARVAGRRSGEGSFTGEGTLDWRQKPTGLTAKGTLSGMALADLLVSMRVAPELARRTSALVDGEFELTGQLAAPTGSITLRGPELAVDGAPLGAMSFVGGFGADEKAAWGQLVAQGKTGTTRLDGEWYRGGNLRLSMKLDGVSITAIRPLLGDIDMDGTMTLTAAVSGPADALSGTVDVRVPDLYGYKTHFRHTTLHGDISKGTMQMRGTTLDKTVAYEGQMNLNRDLTFALTAKYQGLGMEMMWPSLEPLDSSMAGNLFSQGSLMKWVTVQSDIEVSTARFTMGGVTLDAPRPARMQYAEKSLHIIDCTVQGNGLKLSIGGTQDPDGKLAMKVLGNGDLEAARAFMPRLELARGRFDVDLDMGGTWAAPLFQGEIELHGGVMAMPYGLMLENMQGRVLLAGRNIEVPSLTATTSGGGNVRVTAQMRTSAEAATELRLNTELSRVTLRPNNESQTTLSGQLSLAGPMHDLLLRGDIRLESMRYTAQVDLEKLVPKRNLQPLRVPALNPEDAVRLQISVTAPKDVHVSSPVMEAEFAADLMITGTTQRMGMLGNLTALEAKAEYQNVHYTVERASILFTDEYSIKTEYDVRAVAEACGMDLTVLIGGQSDGPPVFQIIGKDERGDVAQKDVMACVYAGIRPQENEGVPDSLGVSSIDAIWTVSGMDAQVKRLFPMVDELRLSSGYSSRTKRNTPRIVIGKELGKNLKATYSRALEGVPDQTLAIDYEINEIATMQGTWNSTNEAAKVGDFGLDLRLRWEFR